MLMVAFRRILIGIPVIVGASVLIFFVLHVLPGDPIAALTAGVPATDEQIANLRKQYGLDEPLMTQFVIYFTNALRGNLGVSYTTNQPVLSMVLSQAPSTFALAGAAVVLSVIIGVGFGVLAAVFRNSWLDSTIRIFSLLGTAMPLFWTAILLIIVFSLTLRWVPAIGGAGPQALVLPAVALSLPTAGVVTRLVRNSMIEVMGENYVTALHAKGISPRSITLKHILRNALIPAITIIGLEAGALLAGTVVAETVFSRPGTGQLLVTAILAKDYPLIQGTMLFVAFVFVAVNIIVDISYAYIDPRVRTTLTKDR